jgi:hypothetical protein
VPLSCADVIIGTRNVAEPADLQGPAQSTNHQDAPWAQHRQALAGADGELGDADVAGAGGNFCKECVAALGGLPVRAGGGGTV